MGCAACANTIENAIHSVAGVNACSVNFGAEQLMDDESFTPDTTEQQERQLENQRLRRKVIFSLCIGGLFRVRFDDFTGRTVYHCHILDHEDQGMMGTLAIQ